MKTLLIAGGAAALLVLAVEAQGERAPQPERRPAPAPASDPGDWTRPLGADVAARAAPAAAEAAAPSPSVPEEEIDVADAHWMALTMWGEARGQGVEAMRAVGHVIDNRRRSGLHGAYVTETVSEAFQFSCWNPGDPNRQAMLDVLALPEGREKTMWRAARAMADEIMTGRSADPTGGALFYHAESVAPAWSRGLVPVRRIGTHLFFRSARSA